MNYLKNLNNEVREYFSILSSDIPDFLNDYINTPEMQKQANISVTCGTIYSKMFNIDMWYSSLDHSVAVALIVWHFTKDKKQTLSGLLHDIATPVFKHCVDFMNGDHENRLPGNINISFEGIEGESLLLMLDMKGIAVS